jgi:endonuclease/exonuclease/phosphatase family metal-dependent hydrolase
MPVLPKPRTRYAYDVEVELRHLAEHRKTRRVPRKGPDRLLLGSWNIANFGAQVRRECDLRLLAEVLSWFDLIALQECRENYADLYDMVGYMGPQYRVVMSDAGGNNERLVFIFDGRKLARLDEIGEIDLPPARAAAVRIAGVRQKFAGFDRNPYLASFRLSGDPLSVQLVNVHLYYGSEAPRDIEQRSLESVAVARWTALRSRSRYAGARELIALGDFIRPKRRKDGSNAISAALASGGLVIPPHSSEIGSSIASDNHYDQVAMLPATNYGSEAPRDIERRSLESVAVARWTALRSKSRYAGARELIALGDFNMPKPRRDGNNAVLAALASGGLVIRPHSSEIGSSIASDNHYDQVAMLPATTREWLVQVGVFDYDTVVFPDLWKSRGDAVFKGYLRYYLSDHRPMWVELRPK